MAFEHIRLGDQYYVLASALALRQPQVLLNHADSFAIFDLAGDIPFAGFEAYGLFHRGTRFLSCFELHLNGGLPILLNTAPTAEGNELVSYLSNADERRGDEVMLERDTIALQRCKTLLENVLYERLQLHNYGQESLLVECELVFGADFADIFELRGTERARRGQLGEARVEQRAVHLPYRGLDGLQRETVLQFSLAPHRLDDSHAAFQFQLAPGTETTLEIQVVCLQADRADRSPPVHTFASALDTIRTERQNWQEFFPSLYSNNEGFNDWLNRSVQDLSLLRTEGEHGSYLYAGIPWFATVFGRDGLIAALETLAFSSDLAAGTLRTLAALQGQHDNVEREEEPGKILHERRYGEMAATGEIPFGHYYGSVDATPLFVLLLAAYADRTSDVALVQELWPAALAAIDWIETRLNRSGNGYLRYAPRTPQGLTNQGWKDSHDAVFHADGRLAEPPIALAEVQAYVYAAYRGLARLAQQIDLAEPPGCCIATGEQLPWGAV